MGLSSLLLCRYLYGHLKLTSIANPDAVVDSEALVVGLRTNQIRGAALDVTDPEPLPVGHPLRSEPRVILTPHWGYKTSAAVVTGFKMAVDNLKAVLIDNVAMPNEVKGEKA